MAWRPPTPRWAAWTAPSRRIAASWTATRSRPRPEFLGDLHKRQGQVDRAVKFYGDAVKADPADPRPTSCSARSTSRPARTRTPSASTTGAAVQEVPGRDLQQLGAIATASATWTPPCGTPARGAQAAVECALPLQLRAVAIGQQVHEEALEQVDAALKLEPNHVDCTTCAGGAAPPRRRRGRPRRFREDPGPQRQARRRPHNIGLIDDLRRAPRRRVVIEGKQASPDHVDVAVVVALDGAWT